MGSEVAESQSKEDTKKTADDDLRALVAVYFLDRFVGGLPALVEVGDDLIEGPSLVPGGLPDAQGIADRHERKK